MKPIYLDNASTTKLNPIVLEAMLPFLRENYGNPSSMHQLGLNAQHAVIKARQKVAEILNCAEEEIIFTASGTESDNLAILGFARKNKHQGNHIISTKIEHKAVLNPLKQLEKEGFLVTYLDVDENGLLDLERLRENITDKTILVSIIYANNEIGTIQDVKEIAKICKEKEVVFHTDACQAAGYLDIDVKNLGADLMTLNGSKIYGPKGVGILYKKKHLQLEPIIYGGGQEFNLRSGTENMANIVGLTKALELSQKEKEAQVQRLIHLRNYLTENLLRIKDTKLNGHQTRRLPNNVNISFLNVEGEALMLMLNEEGICVSTGSACSSSALEPSHVLLALGLSHELAHSSIRFTLSKDTTKEDLDYVLEKLPPIVEKLRQISALNNTLEKPLEDKK